jgi:hypothetical protein
MRNVRVPLALSLLIAGLMAGTAPADASSERTVRADTTVRSDALSETGRRVTVDVKVNRFVVQGGRVVARGAATSRVRTRDGKVRRQRNAVVLTAAAGDSCRVLYLRLDDLQVKLLGLDLNASTVTVRIQGDDQRVLGRLFCRLAQAIRLRSVTRAAGVARSLNRRLGARPMQIVRLRADLNAQAAQAAPAGTPVAACQLLDLTIGPLHLDLLGLVAEIYGANRTQPVRVVATADPNAGVLGRTLCKLANGQAVGDAAAPFVPLSESGRQATVNVQVDRFSVQDRHIVARGAATSRVTTRDGMVRTQTQPVQLAVGAGDGCRVLYLRLDDLQVKLLGLNLDTSTVTVRIHGESSRVLGRLFCQLARAISLQRTANIANLTRSLNRGLNGKPLQVLGLRAALYAQDAQAPADNTALAPTCPILDLTIGPLNLDLLGLIVDLYGATKTQPVRVVATADPNGGVLGSTLCRLANGQANS